MNFKKSHITLVTGANGFIGQLLVRKMIEKTTDKLILNCRKIQTPPSLSSRVFISSIDICDENSIAELMETHRPDHIIHLAAITRVNNGELEADETFRTNYLSTVRLINHAKKYKVKKFLFVSSDLANEPVSVIGISKFFAEAYIQNNPESHLKLITIRLPNVSYSPGSVHQIFEKLIGENKPLTITDPAMTRRFISLTEAADYLLYVLKTAKNKDILVINKRPVKITALAEQMIGLSGKELEIKFIGKRTGEKTEEQIYLPGQVKSLPYNDLSILLQKDFSFEKINEVKQRMKLKTSFSLLNDLDRI